MKKENGIYLLAFLCGVVIVNLLGIDTWANSSILNRYSLASLSFQEIAYEEYFVQVLLLRLRTIAVLWILSRVVPKKIVVIGFAGVISIMLGGILAMSILANGIWGIFFFLSALLPHGIFYVLAYTLWSNAVRSNSYNNYTTTMINKEKILVTVLVFMLTIIGSICEAYICPILMKNVIKF